jgi:hypothetical protein
MSRTKGFVALAAVVGVQSVWMATPAVSVASPTPVVASNAASRRVTLSNPGSGVDRFGGSVDISGTTAIVGADETDSGAGAAYIYVKGKGGWPNKPTVSLPDPVATANDTFGYSVAISGTTAVVGAYGSNSALGVAYVYQKGAAGWPTMPTATLVDPKNGFEFGIAVATSGTTVVIGANGSNTASAAAYIYSEDEAGWPTAPTATLLDPDPTVDQSFGDSVAISGNTVVVGSYSLHSQPGWVYLYVETGSGWPTVPRVTLSDPGPAFDYFGASLAASGSTLIVGAYDDDVGGAAFVYVEGQAGWPERPTATLTDGSTTNLDYFGYSVAVSGGTAVIGAYGTGKKGVAYIYKGGRDGWPTKASRVLAEPVSAANPGFGVSVSVSGNRAIIGAEGGLGAAYIFPS